VIESARQYRNTDRHHHQQVAQEQEQELYSIESRSTSQDEITCPELENSVSTSLTLPETTVTEHSLT
jgi:hypothetical protein